jgi:hypothetical protein
MAKLNLELMSCCYLEGPGNKLKVKLEFNDLFNLATDERKI